MFFPYFRGRQYELLALKELAARRLITPSVIPVVEPVKLIPALNNALTAFDDAELQIGLIINPDVGDLVDESETVNQRLEELIKKEKVIPSVLLNESTESALIQLSLDKNEILVVLNNRDYLDIYQNLFDEKEPTFTLCPDERAFRRTINQNKVLFEDHFKRKNRNADYPEDEPFSADHLDYAEDKYVGFGDYSIVGSEYIESGFAPYAVAIHIVYLARDNSLRIRHFVSDTNDDISDVAGKFYEAVTKLYNWYSDGHQERQLTAGLQTLLDHYKNRTYPGLPTLKKLSIMHHLELMSEYLKGAKKAL